MGISLSGTLTTAVGAVRDMSLARLTFGSEANVLLVGRGAAGLMNTPPKYRAVLRLRICETLEYEKMDLIVGRGLGRK